MPKRKLTDYYSARKRRRTNKYKRTVAKRKRMRRGRNAVPRVLRSLVETKVYSGSVSDADVGNNGHFMYLNALIAQGDALNEREGRKITCTKVQFRAELYPASVSIFNKDRWVRFLLFIDKTPNQETMSLSDIIDVTHPHISFRTWNESFRYKLLTDKLVKLPCKRQLNSLDVENTVVGSQVVEFSLPMRMQSEWLSTTGGTDQITRNSLVMAIVSDNSTSYVSMKGVYRVQFVDL